MTTRILKDSNWSSARASILQKYDKNGDGKFDQVEVEAIIDDYMGTIYQQQSLAEWNKVQKKIIIFGAIMFVLLTISNLGTGIAAANLSKDIKVIDGKLMGTDEDGTNAALATEKVVRTFSTKNSGWYSYSEDIVWRRLNEDEDGNSTKAIACISPEKAKDVFDAVTTSGHVNLALDVFDKMFILPIQGLAIKSGLSVESRRLEADGMLAPDAQDYAFSYSFPESRGVMFVADDPSCEPEDAEERRLATKRIPFKAYGVYVNGGLAE